MIGQDRSETNSFNFQGNKVDKESKNKKATIPRQTILPAAVTMDPSQAIKQMNTRYRGTGPEP